MEILYVKISLAVLFALAVIAKLTGKTKSTFENSGYSHKVMYATALSEFVFTVMLFTKLELVGVIGLLVIIGGAIFTLFRQKVKPEKYSLAVIALILLSVLLYFLIR
jgi:hypothetical protein